MRPALRPSALKDWQGKPAQSMSHVGISLFFKSLKSGKITFGEKLRRIICWTCLLLSQAAAWTWGTRKFSYPWITASMPLHNVTTRSNKRSASEALGGGVATRGRVRRRDSSSRSAVSLLRRTRVADAHASGHDVHVQIHGGTDAKLAGSLRDLGAGAQNWLAACVDLRCRRTDVM